MKKLEVVGAEHASSTGAKAGVFKGESQLNRTPVWMDLAELARFVGESRYLKPYKNPCQEGAASRCEPTTGMGSVCREPEQWEKVPV